MYRAAAACLASPRRYPPARAAAEPLAIFFTRSPAAERTWMSTTRKRSQARPSTCRASLELARVANDTVRTNQEIRDLVNACLGINQADALENEVVVPFCMLITCLCP